MTVALVTGAGSGIGQAVARVLAGHGARVVCADLDEAAAKATADDLDGALGVLLDVADEAMVDELVARTERELGPIDWVVACAGANAKGTPTEMDVETFERVMKVNVTGSFLVARAAARGMVERGTGGSIVLIGSINSVHALSGQVAYATSKGAVLMLGKVMAVDLAPHDIRVNVVGPGLTRTPMSAAMIANEEKMRWAMERIPMKKVAEPVDIADVVAFLLSDAARHVTGTFIPVDGGWLTGA
jgi:NAD(P)-dependent dehydrogenase (short-subunit alcohol dehydrogenase family)